ncbi:MAG: transporter [Lachnospiraceae bacterium]|nr:transporter [Lachnospiraceae bacterium]
MQNWIYPLTHLLELIVSIFLIIAIVLSFITLGKELLTLGIKLDTTEMFKEYMSTIFDVVIGIEFLKMICKQNLNTVIEVLLFAIARQLIVEHMSMLNSLVGIVAISMLFLVRKYLFIEKLDRQKEDL